MQANPASPLLSRYTQLVQRGDIKHDEAQLQVLVRLEALLAQLATPARAGLLSRLLGRKPEAATSLYVWGNVGRGKSMLMNLFFDAAPTPDKKRVHFHAFMQQVHKRLHELRRQQGYKGDPIAELVRETAAATRLLCFDELQAADVTDASVIYRIFMGLLNEGVVIVSTSNHPPASLYTGGVQRERFAKLTALIEKNMQVLALSSAQDYRMSRIQSLERRYFSPLGQEADAFIATSIARITDSAGPRRGQLSVQGRTIHFTLYDQTVGQFTFAELCQANLGPADYLALASRLETLILTGIPAMTPEQRNEAKRFVTLIDALYEHKVKLIATAEAPPEALYTDGDGSFEFHRTASRLAEMQSDDYAVAHD